MEFDEFANLIKENCPQILRNSWKPIEAKESSSSKLITKFGGSNPFRRTNFKWPRCSDEKCGRQKAFICQINVGDLPDQLKTRIGKNSGLFQMFWCTARFNCDKYDKVEGVEYDDFGFNRGIGGLNSNIWIIPRGEMIPSLQSLSAVAVWESKVNTNKLPDLLKTFVEKTNEQFEGVQDQWEQVVEETQVGSFRKSEVIEIPEEKEFFENEKIYRIIEACPEVEEASGQVDFSEGLFTEPIGIPVTGEVKLGGYISWFEGDMAYSDCPDCKVVMDVTFLQLESDHILKYDWDSGAASITLCPNCGKLDMYWIGRSSC